MFDCSIVIRLMERKNQYRLGDFVLKHDPRLGDVLCIPQRGGNLMTCVDMVVLAALPVDSPDAYEPSAHLKPLVMTTVMDESLSVFFETLEINGLEPWGNIEDENEEEYNLWHRKEARQGTT